ncbi:Hint domain-containing protein [Gluconobacter japonicus]|uniref:Hint domain-containing protein n=3 Tax=Gluconobacter japonicus TaxID=376620 RepID=UPI0035F0F501
MSSYIVSSGKYLSNGDIPWTSGGTYYDYVSVLSGGIVKNETLISGGSISVGSGGRAVGTVISSGGSLTFAGGGSGSYTQLLPGGTLNIGSGTTYDNQHTTSLTATSGAQINVLSGGTLSNADAASGGSISVGSGGRAVGTVISSGGSLTFAGGGSGSYTQLLPGGTLNIGSGTTYDNQHTTSLTATSGAQINVLSGGTLSNADAKQFGNIIVKSGGATENAIISSGGGLGVAGTASGTIINSGGVLEITSGGIANDNTITSGGAIDADAGSVVGTTTVSSGGSLTVASSAAISGVVTIANGGSATIWNNAGGSIDLVGDTNHGLTISGLENGGTVSTVISGYTGTGPGDSDSIDLAGVSPTGATYSYPSNDQVVVTLSNGNTITLNIEGVKTTGFALVSDGNGGSLAEVCFLAGSLISIPSGTIAVEKLAVGDNVTAYVDGTETVRQVTWAGQARCTVRPHLALDQAGYPVRILKNAISEGVPFKDMLITAEHCLFFDGKFVPARMLVNGRSIFYDTSITSYDYYHIETADHSVIMADGMLTESYLDTGNRRAFRQNNAVVSIPLSRDLSWDDAAAPLTVSREAVEPIFRQIEVRAKEQNCPVHSEAPSLTYDSDLHLVTDTGATIRAARTNNDQVIFMIPVGVDSVRIVSRASRPYDALGPFVDDRRTLGVLVGDIRMFESNATRLLSAHLTEEGLSGWSNVEDGTVRWTDGNAFLSLGHRPLGSIALLSVQILASGPYLVTDTTLDVALQA